MKIDRGHFRDQHSQVRPAFQSTGVTNGLAAILTIAGMLSPTFSVADENSELHPAFTKESLRDPFLTPAKAQTTGPLDEDLIDEERRFHPADGSAFSPTEPKAVFEESEESNCTPSGGPPNAASRRAVMDIGLTTTWLAPVDGFGVTDVETKASLVIPVFIKGSPLRLAFNLGTTLIDAPAGLDVPDQLYGLQAELRWFIPWREGLAIDLGMGGGVYSDLNDGASGFRIVGRALFIKDLSTTVKLSLGVLYLGRENLLAVPVAGLIYTPQPETRIELLFPRIRFLKRISAEGPREHWLYAGTEFFGGNSWAIEHAGGAKDEFIYSDQRLIIGYETKSPGKLGGRLELGYVFSRHVEFEKDPTEFDPGSTVLFRAGVTY